VHLDAFEVDPCLADACEAAVAHARRWLAARGTRFTFAVHRADFVLTHAGALAPGLFERTGRPRYDLAISNPPYFKLAKADPRARAASAIVHGQPNIYALFMAIMASLLADGGAMVTITPRSFATGDYFRRFRQHFFGLVAPQTVHLFHSRKATFKRDAVLQENVILRACRTALGPTAAVEVSTSEGAADLPRRSIRKVPLAAIVDARSHEAVFSIPAGESDDAVAAFVRRWKSTLRHHGLEVSTGPVVAFRARRFLAAEPNGARVAPLLWLHNVQRAGIEWPCRRGGKPQFIVDGEESRKLLLPSRTYIVLRRFTAKEEHRRLTAAPLYAGTLPGAFLGLENHLNYIHRPGGTLDADEAAGLAALLGSGLLDRFFRVSNGSTQVNAVELRALPLPPRRTLLALGAAVRGKALAAEAVEEAVCDAVRVPARLRAMIKGAADGDA
jgi:adenine-specific DNA-methyltransferase